MKDQLKKAKLEDYNNLTLDMLIDFLMEVASISSEPERKTCITIVEDKLIPREGILKEYKKYLDEANKIS